MTENQEVPGRKRRSSEEIKRLVAEFEASGLRQREFCRNHGLALSSLQRQLKNLSHYLFLLLLLFLLSRFR
jgi:hypothetical protein